jgi:transglutaminase-like putative cysteine protease
MRRFARDVLTGEGGDRLAAMHAMMVRLHSDMRFAPGMTTSATPAGEAFSAGHGVCQDFAHIFVACARSIGVPARYAGGYFLRTDSIDQDAGHAWAEAYLQGIGWIAFDPAHGMCTTDRYCRVAVGLDYLDAAPVRGSRVGGGDEKLNVQVQVQQGRTIKQG